MKRLNIFLLFYLLGIAFCFSQENVFSGLVAFYEFELNGADSSPNSFDGTLYGNPEFIERSNEWALSFDGVDDYFRVNENFEPFTEFTWSFWLYLTEADFQQPAGMIIATQKPPAAWHPFVEIDQIDDTLNFTAGNGGASLGKTDFPMNDWFMLTVIRYYNGGVAMFVNDELKTTGESSLREPNDYLIIGGQEPVGKFAKFLIDDVRLYNRALSNTEVESLYLESVNGSNVRRAAKVLPTVINGFLVGAEILDGGYGYATPPTITITGGGGSGAQAVAVVSSGRVTGIQVRSTGRGYTSDPIITIASPPIPLARATAEAEIVNGFVIGVNLLDSGYGYADPPEVTLLDSQGTGAEVVSVVEDGRVVGFEILNTGRGYSENTIVQIALPPFAPEMSIRVKSIELNLHLVVGKSYVIEATDDFILWTPVSDPFVADNEFMAFEYEVGVHGNYYRVVETP